MADFGVQRAGHAARPDCRKQTVTSSNFRASVIAGALLVPGARLLVGLSFLKEPPGRAVIIGAVHGSPVVGLVLRAARDIDSLTLKHQTGHTR